MARVLICEDDQALRARYVRWLTALGHEVRIDGSTDSWATWRPDVVILDRHLAYGDGRRVVDGLLLCRRIRLVVPHAWILLVTGDDGPGIEEQARAAGVDRVVIKDEWLRAALLGAVAEGRR